MRISDWSSDVCSSDLYRSADQSRDAEARADELIAALDDAGAMVTPSQDQIVNVLGDDGGAVCANPNDALSRATLQAQLAHGAGARKSGVTGKGVSVCGVHGGRRIINKQKN